ncbi:MAG: glycyl-radical enzyme activating protein [Actinomycetota bacterium]
MPAESPTGLIFDVQRYCVYDGPGIRTGVFLKGCPMRCFWCHNPESQAKVPEVRFLASRCDGCGECLKVCDPKAVRLRGKTLQWDLAECDGCGRCVDVCSEGAFLRVGEEVSVEQAVERATADLEFFVESEGGVTVTGGEPTTQPEFLLALLGALRARGVRAALETAGLFPRELLQPLADVTDLFLFDIKHVDDEKHRAGTGTGNRSILENFAALIGVVGSGRVTPRIPLIPGFNTEAEDIEAIAAFLVAAGYSGETHLMPYHGWAKGKYESLGRLADYRDLSSELPVDVERISAQFEERGFGVRLHG